MIEEDFSELALTFTAGIAIQIAVIVERIIQRLRLNKIPDNSIQFMSQIRKFFIEIRNSTNPFHLKQADITLERQANWERVKIYGKKLATATNDVCSFTENLLDKFEVIEKQEVQADIIVIRKLAQDVQEIIERNSE